VIGHYDERGCDHQKTPRANEHGSPQSVSNLALQEIAMKPEVRFFVGRNLCQHIPELPVRQAHGQQLVVTDTDDLGGQQHHDL
jgi:hypothetical protein